MISTVFDSTPAWRNYFPCNTALYITVHPQHTAPYASTPLQLPNSLLRLPSSTHATRRPRSPREPPRRTWSSRPTSTTARVRHAAILAKANRGPRRRNRTGINAHGNPPEDTLLDALAEVHVVEHGVRGGCFLGEDAVVDVEEEFLRVGRVGRAGFGGGDEGLVEEELADVGDVAAGEGLVLLVDGGVDMGEDWLGG